MHSSCGWLHVASTVHMHTPQSLGHVPQFSSELGWQMPSPHDAQTPQSARQFEQRSPPWQMPSPQRRFVRQRPQSARHVAHVSPAVVTQRASPHTAPQAPQS
jgi:hypothetical protein